MIRGVILFDLHFSVKEEKRVMIQGLPLHGFSADSHPVRFVCRLTLSPLWKAKRNKNHPLNSSLTAIESFFWVCQNVS